MYSPKGKPGLASDCQVGSPSQAIDFNLSHSGDLAVYAVARDCDVGVDVEQLRPIAEALQIAEKFFSAPERAELATVPHAQLPEAFLNCWTRKEAYVKALGDGLSAPLDSFQVSLLPGRPAEFINMSGASMNEKEWLLRDLQPSPGYVAALAFRRPQRRLRIRNFTTTTEAAEVISA